jgi:hypothetical protein
VILLKLPGIELGVYLIYTLTLKEVYLKSMKTLLKTLFLFSFSMSFSQENSQKKDTLKGSFLGASYSIIDQTTFIKKNGKNENTYRNFALGKITTFDVLSPFEIILFYKDFNTVVILDNYLNEIQSISFSETIFLANKSIVNKLWLYNSDKQKLQLFDYKSQTIILSSQTFIDFEPIKMVSDFNAVKLIGKKKTLIFNQYLSLVDTIIHQKNN